MIPIEQYYTAPSQEIFDDIQKTAVAIWRGYDDTYGYSTEKILRVEDITNIKDNAWAIVAMFDMENKGKLLLRVKREDTRQILLELLND